MCLPGRRAVSALQRAWDAAWFGPVLDLRVWVLHRVLLAVLALDAWVLMIERGGRYGAGGFNVAHFAWLDQVQPLPTAAFYVGLILTCGVLAMLLTLGVLGRLGLVSLTVLYTYAWAMSQLDSYQHHVFVSWVLLCLCFFPTLSTRDVFGDSAGAERCGQEICAWGFRLLAALTALLYFFTGISKAEPQWLSGGVLKRINGSDGHLEVFREFVMGLGASEETFWTLGGYSVVVLQWVITGLWLSLLVWGESGGRWVRLGRFFGVLAALAFHLGAEILGLRIGWFSWYMLALTLIAFVPGRWLQSAGVQLRRLVVVVDANLSPLTDGRARAPWVALCVCSAACFAALGPELDLPGTRTAALLWAGLVLAAAFWATLRGASLRTWAVAAALTVSGLSVTMDASRVRYDYYRYVGGDATRRLELQSALDAYGRANTYAPQGEGRWAKADKVRAKLRRAR